MVRQMNNQKRLTRYLAIGTVAALGLAGCAMEESPEWSADFGDSVRHTIALQTGGATHEGTGMDAVKAETVLRAYREDVAKPKSVERDIIFRVGQ
ncbi:hypothetical protein [Thiocystis violacea]|uniref:hypothetical protein n=1 Tax=Thiocystis violacea TaxID=13725 RepID=UPI001902D9F7|nr:hypothetical protein [Thiocystis violacea]MBK1719244.1 hypothetical protein [Thiocystis violacea]